MPDTSSDQHAEYVSLEEFLEELRAWVQHTREQAYFSTVTVLNDLEAKLNEVLDGDQSDCPIKGPHTCDQSNHSDGQADG